MQGTPAGPPRKPPLSEATRQLGARVRAGRLDLQLTQEALAEQTHFHWSYVGQVERGQVNLTLHNLLRFAEALQVDAADLVHGLTPPEPDVPA